MPTFLSPHLPLVPKGKQAGLVVPRAGKLHRIRQRLETKHGWSWCCEEAPVMAPASPPISWAATDLAALMSSFCLCSWNPRIGSNGQGT